jgi:hypothetical protein
MIHIRKIHCMHTYTDAYEYKYMYIYIYIHVYIYIYICICQRFLLYVKDIVLRGEGGGGLRQNT